MNVIAAKRKGRCLISVKMNNVITEVAKNELLLTLNLRRTVSRNLGQFAIRMPCASWGEGAGLPAAGQVKGLTCLLVRE
jgi:hypothetical protein